MKMKESLGVGNNTLQFPCDSAAFLYFFATLNLTNSTVMAFYQTLDVKVSDFFCHSAE